MQRGALAVPVITLPNSEPIIVTTDGVHDALSQSAVEETVRELADEPAGLAAALVAATDEQSYRDDATAVVLASRESWDVRPGLYHAVAVYVE